MSENPTISAFLDLARTEELLKDAIGSIKKEPRNFDSDYLFSESARRAIFFAKYEAQRRNTDEVTHHITLADLEAGIAREKQGKPKT